MGRIARFQYAVYLTAALFLLYCFPSSAAPATTPRPTVVTGPVPVTNGQNLQSTDSEMREVLVMSAGRLAPVGIITSKTITRLRSTSSTVSQDFKSTDSELRMFFASEPGRVPLTQLKKLPAAERLKIVIQALSQTPSMSSSHRKILYQVVCNRDTARVPEGLKLLIEGLNIPEVAPLCADSLRLIPIDSQTTVSDVLLKCVANPTVSDNVRYRVIEALANYGTRQQPIIPDSYFDALVTSSSLHVGSRACALFGVYRRIGSSALFQRYSKTQDPILRKFLIQNAPGYLPSGDISTSYTALREQLFQLVIRGLRDTNKEVRLASIEALPMFESSLGDSKGTRGLLSPEAVQALISESAALNTAEEIAKVENRRVGSIGYPVARTAAEMFFVLMSAALVVTLYLTTKLRLSGYKIFIMAVVLSQIPPATALYFEVLHKKSLPDGFVWRCSAVGLSCAAVFACAKAYGGDRGIRWVFWICAIPLFIVWMVMGGFVLLPVITPLGLLICIWYAVNRNRKSLRDEVAVPEAIDS